MNDEKEISVFLDRIEELEDDSALAVLLIELDADEDEYREFTLPADLLPEGTSEGEYLTLKISRNKLKTAEALEEARELLKRNQE